MSDFKFQQYTWSQIRDKVLKTDPDFCEVVDEWDPGKEYTLIELSYPFGAHILDIYRGGFQIPNIDGRTVPLSDPSVPAQLKKELGYSSLPLGLPIQGGVEVYHLLEDRVFSLAFFSLGFNLGIWEAFGPPAPYSVSAGARSLIMAPKITDTENHKKLKDVFGLRHGVPRNLFDQWPVFVELVQKSKTSWETKVLFLNHKWAEPKKKSIGWLKFHNFLRKRAWEHTEYVRYKSVFEVSWKHFCQVLQAKGERFDPYLIETLRHVVCVAQGMLPGFAAVGDDEVSCPSQFLMKTYIDKYALKNYVPTLLAPCRYKCSDVNQSPVYYSFQNPTLLDAVPKVKTFSSAVDDMRNFKVLMEYFIEAVLNGGMRFGNGDLLKMINNTHFDYFHSEMHTYGGIQPSSTLPENDNKLMYMPGECGDRQFASKGSFFRCCLRISSK